MSNLPAIGTSTPIQFSGIKKETNSIGGTSIGFDAQTSGDLYEIRRFASPGYRKPFEVAGSVEGNDGRPVHYRLRNGDSSDVGAGLQILIQDRDNPEVERGYSVTQMHPERSVFQSNVSRYESGVRVPQDNKKEVSEADASLIVHIAEAGRQAIQQFNQAKALLLNRLQYVDPNTNHLSAISSPDNPQIHPDKQEKST